MEPFLEEILLLPKGVITLQKKAGRHIWEDLDDNRRITELKILAQVLANFLQLIISDLNGPVQNYPMKGRSFHDNLRLPREILKGLKDDTEAALII